MAAAAIAVINIKPKDVSLEDFLNQLQTSIQNDKVEDECMDLTVCSDDFILDLDSTDNDKINDDNKYTEVAHDQSIMECTITEDNMEATAKLAKTETFNCKNKYAEVVNSQSIKKNKKKIKASKKLDKTNTVNYKNKYAEVVKKQPIKKNKKKMKASKRPHETNTFNYKNTYINDQSIKGRTKNIEATKKLTETETFNYKNIYAGVATDDSIKENMKNVKPILHGAYTFNYKNKYVHDQSIKECTKNIECIDLTACSDDCILDLDSKDNDKMKDANKYNEIGNDQSIMKCTITDNNMEVYVKSAEIERFNLKNKYAEMSNDNSIMKDIEVSKKLDETNTFNYKNTDANDKSIKDSTKNIEATRKLTETETFNYKNTYAEVAIDESIKESTKNIKATEELDETRTLNNENKYEEVANSQSIMKNMKNIRAPIKRKIFNYKNIYPKANNQSMKKCTEVMEASEHLTDTETFRFSEFNTPVITQTQQLKSKTQRKSKIKKNVQRKHNAVTNIEMPKSIHNTIKLDSQATELYDIPLTQMLDSHISQTQEEDDKRFAILDKYVLGIPKKKVPKIVELPKVVEVKRYENIQSPNIFDSQQECGQDYDMYNDEYNIDTLEVIPPIKNYEHSKPVIVFNNKGSEIPEYKNNTQDSVNNIHNNANYPANENTKAYCGSKNAIEIEERYDTILPNTNTKRTAHNCTPATRYLEIHSHNNEVIINNCSQIVIGNKKAIANNTMKSKMNNNDKEIDKNNENIINSQDTIDKYSDIINNVQNYLHKHDINNLEENMESQTQTQLLDISNNREDGNAGINFNSQNQFSNISQINFDKDVMSSNLDVLATLSSYIDSASNLNFNANNEIRNETADQTNIQHSQKPYLEYEDSIKKLNTKKFKAIENVYSQDIINNLDTNNFKPVENFYFQDIELEDNIEIRNEISHQSNFQNSQNPCIEYKDSINNLNTNNFKQIENLYSQDMELEDDIEVSNTENSIPFKIIMELNAVKSWLNKNNKICSGGYGTDSGYKSDNQKNMFCEYHVMTSSISAVNIFKTLNQTKPEEF